MKDTELKRHLKNDPRDVEVLKRAVKSGAKILWELGGLFAAAPKGEEGLTSLEQTLILERGDLLGIERRTIRRSARHVRRGDAFEAFLQAEIERALAETGMAEIGGSEE